MKGRTVHDLNQDYVEALTQADRLGLPDDHHDRLAAYQRFFARNGYRLALHPGAMREVMLAEPADSCVRADVLAEVDGQTWRPARPWFRRMHVPPSDPEPGLLATIDVGTWVHSVAWLEWGGRPHALVGAGDGVRQYEVDTGRLVRELRGHSSFVNAVVLSPEGRHALSGSGDRTLRWWDLGSGTCSQTLQGHSGGVNAVAVSPDGRHALSGSADRTLRFWDLEGGSCQLTLQGHTGGVKAVAVSPDGRRALSGSADHTLRFWDLENGACNLTLRGHSDGVHAVAVSPDGKRALSGSADRTLRFWDLESGSCRLTLLGHSSWVTAVALSADCRHALSGSADHALRYWDLEQGRCMAVFTWDYPIRALSLSPPSSNSPSRIVAGDDRGHVIFLALVRPTAY
jgi:WD40 repeat protein